MGQFAKVFTGVDAEELAGGGRGGDGDFNRSVLGDQQVAGLRKFFHRERMPRREGEEEIRVIEAAEARRHDPQDASEGLARQTI